MLVENLSVCGHESARPIKRFLTFTSTGIEALGNGVRHLRQVEAGGPGGSVGRHLAVVRPLVGCEVVPVSDFAWTGESYGLTAVTVRSQVSPSGFMTSFMLGTASCLGTDSLSWKPPEHHHVRNVSWLQGFTQIKR